jgi:hypothetical protein
MSYEKVVTLFDTAEHAEAARRNLEKAGFPANDISIIGKQGLGSGATLREPGLWHRLFGSNIAEHEARVYGQTVEAGGVVLTLRTPDSEVPKAMGILNQHNVVDVQNRAVESGWLPKRAVRRQQVEERTVSADDHDAPPLERTPRKEDVQ